jgi:hypothetical protein
MGIENNEISNFKDLDGREWQGLEVFGAQQNRICALSCALKKSSLVVLCAAMVRSTVATLGNTCKEVSCGK